MCDDGIVEIFGVGWLEFGNLMIGDVNCVLMEFLVEVWIDLIYSFEIEIFNVCVVSVEGVVGSFGIVFLI